MPQALGFVFLYIVSCNRLIMHISDFILNYMLY